MSLRVLKEMDLWGAHRMKICYKVVLFDVKDHGCWSMFRIRD